MNRRPTKDRIREAALAIFSEGGPRAVTMRRVAARVGVSATALYRHYANRSALLSDIWDAGFVSLLHELQPPIPVEDCNERILEISARYIRWAVANPDLFDVVYGFNVDVYGISRSPVGTEAACEISAILYREVGNCVRSGNWRTADISSLALTLWAQARGLYALYRTGRIAVTAEQMPEFCRASMRLVIEGLAMPESRQA